MSARAEILVATIRKGSREEFRISRDRGAVSLRAWFRAADGSMRPGADGITVPSHALAEIVDALAKAMRP